MRYLTFSTRSNTTPRLGALIGDRLVEIQQPATLLDLVRGGPDLWTRVATSAAWSHEVDSTELRWHAPIPRTTKNVFCVGRNFVSHAEEGARARGEELKLPERPMFFTKAPTTIIGAFDDLPWDQRATQQVDWEAELGVVIGVNGINIPRARALSHVFGYTVINDVTARDLQRSHGQFFKGKSLDGFCPMGPVVVTADEFGDPQAKDISCRVNGVEKQRGNTRAMIFAVDVLIESLSSGLTLEAGDIIATGTPEGVGFARTPPEFLRVGDLMETEVQGIGILRNRVVARA